MLAGSRSMFSKSVDRIASFAVTDRSMSTLYTVLSSSCGFAPRPAERAPCGSKSTMSTLRP